MLKKSEKREYEKRRKVEEEMSRKVEHKNGIVT